MNLATVTVEPGGASCGPGNAGYAPKRGGGGRGSNVSHSELSELLAILFKLGQDVHKDARILLGTLKDCKCNTVKTNNDK